LTVTRGWQKTWDENLIDNGRDFSSNFTCQKLVLYIQVFREQFRFDELA